MSYSNTKHQKIMLKYKINVLKVGCGSNGHPCGSNSHPKQPIFPNYFLVNKCLFDQ